MRKKQSNWIDMTDVLSGDKAKTLEVGQTLAFMNRGNREEYKIVRIKHGKIWVKPHTTMTVEEFEETYQTK